MNSPNSQSIRETRSFKDFSRAVNEAGLGSAALSCIQGIESEHWWVSPRFLDAVINEGAGKDIRLHMALAYKIKGTGPDASPAEMLKALWQSWLSSWPSERNVVARLKVILSSNDLPLKAVIGEMFGTRSPPVPFRYEKTSKQLIFTDPVHKFSLKNGVDFIQLCRDAALELKGAEFEKSGEPWCLPEYAQCRDFFCSVSTVNDMVALSLEMERSPGAIYSAWSKMGLLDRFGRRFCLFYVHQGKIVEVPARAGFFHRNMDAVIAAKSLEGFGRSIDTKPGIPRLI